MKKFFEPLQEEFSKKMLIPLLIASFGTVPTVFVARKFDSIWVCLGFFLLWYSTVFILYCAYFYLKNKLKNQ